MAREALSAEGRLSLYPLGGAVSLAELETNPHPALARLREREPVSWIPALDCWLVTRHDLALEVVRDAETFTVDDPRFSTAQVVGPSMLSLDGAEHARHRGPFARPFRLDAVRERFTTFVGDEVNRLIDEIEPDGAADLRRSLAGPLSVASMVHALGLEETDPADALGWYEAIVAEVTRITAGEPCGGTGTRAFGELRGAVEPALDRDPSASLVAAAAGEAGGLSRADVVSNAAVLLFGGIETTEGMIANAIWHVLRSDRVRDLVASDAALVENAVEESLRLEPAAAVVDRYATQDAVLGGAAIRERELVRVSLAGANRDPELFSDPDRFDVRRSNARRQLAFAQGPHVCLGMHLARLEAQTALARLLERLPNLRLDPGRPSVVRGLVFRKPISLHVLWD
ncbi:MAG: cytochrome P450 [Gaiellaceae bacterium]